MDPVQSRGIQVRLEVRAFVLPYIKERGDLCIAGILRRDWGFQSVSLEVSVMIPFYSSYQLTEFSICQGRWMLTLDCPRNNLL